MSNTERSYYKIGFLLFESIDEMIIYLQLAMLAKIALNKHSNSSVNGGDNKCLNFKKKCRILGEDKFSLHFE